MLKIYGKGGQARVVESFLPPGTDYGFVDSEDFDQERARDHEWLIAIGSNAARERISEGELSGCAFATILSPHAIIRGEVGQGSVIHDAALIQTGAQIGAHCIINTRASIDHDCKIGDYVHIAPGCTLCGNVTVGAGSFLGAGTVVIPGITIGEGCVIGAGSVVVRDIPDHTKAYGNPARPRGNS